MNRKKDIINTIRSISGRYSEYEVFTDWIRCCALSISNSMDMIHGKVWKDRERTYLYTIKKYTAKEAEEFSTEMIDGNVFAVFPAYTFKPLKK